MKKLSKILSVMIAAIMLISSMGMVAFAAADVTITFANAAMENADVAGQPLLVTNVVNTASGREGVEGWHIAGGLIKFNFSEEMDVTTLTPENIKIQIGSVNYINTANEKLITVDNGDSTYTYYWDYEPYEVTSTSYTIAIADMCEGTQTHTVTFTSGVKTAAGTEINEVKKAFRTGRIVTTQGTEGKIIKDVAYGKTPIRDNGDGTTTELSKWVDYYTAFDSSSASYTGVSTRWTRFDLGNYYDISDVIVYNTYDATASFSAHWNLEVAYSNDPDATGATATPWGNVGQNGYYTGGNKLTGSNGGRGFSRYLSPAEPVRARYIFLRCANSSAQYGEQISTVKIISALDTDYGAITATKDGAAVTEFSGAGEYVITAKATQHKAGTANAYMIVAGYDADGIITKIACDSVEYADNALAMTVTMPEGTASLKASLIKDFTSPYLLTDALVLPAAAQ